MKTIITRATRVAFIALGVAGAAVTAISAEEKSGASSSPSGQQGSSENMQKSGSAQDANSQFFTDCARSDLAQIVIGALAIEKGTTDDVKSYGRTLIDNHSKALKELMDLASRKRAFVTLGQGQKLIPSGLAQIEQQSGTDFDKAVLMAAVSNENRAQAALQQFSQQGNQDADIRDFSSSRMSNINDRLSDSRNLAGKLGIAADQLGAGPSPVGEQGTPGGSSTPSQTP